MDFRRGHGLLFSDRRLATRLTKRGGLCAVIGWRLGFIATGENHNTRGRFNERT
jgi:hypothetical protein